MDLLPAALVAAVAVVGFLGAYKLKSPRPLPASKPSFCLLPKFESSISLPRSIAEAAQPSEPLAERMAEADFSVAQQTDDALVFSRGSVLGGFSVEIAKITVRFTLPLQSSARFSIEYGSFAAFDTGDLWQFTEELTARVERAV